jgi:hypothetical protein
MSCCPIWASRALLIEPEYILSEVVVRCFFLIDRGAECARQIGF